VDDNPSIHEDFNKILLSGQNDDGFDDLLQDVLGDSDNDTAVDISYSLSHAYQGEEAFNLVSEAHQNGQPYAVVFMDVRMPPGMNGIQTIQKIWDLDPNVECVICTAFSDYSWEEILATIGSTDQLQFLRKPFDVVSIRQMALALTKKWNLALSARNYQQNLEAQVAERTRELNDKVNELQKAMDEISQLRGILPMCAYCHKVRDDGDYWQRVDEYIQNRTPAEISHGVCPECYEKVLAPMLEDE
jgi:YesN/AraC family two-component response regulator